MNIRIILLFLLTSITIGLNAQTYPITLKVVDLDSATEIKGAIVFIDELHFEDTETDDYGVAYFENVPKGKVNLSIRKKGYLPIRESFNVTDDKVNNMILVRLKRVEDKSKAKDDKDKLNFSNSPGTIIIGGDNKGVIQGDNSYFDNRKTYVNAKVDIPKPKIKLLSVDSLNRLTSINPRAKEKQDSLSKLSGEFFKTVLRFKYESEIQRSNIDFHFLLKSTFHVDIKFIEGMYELSSFQHFGKITGRRIYRPENGTYEFTIYTQTPINNIHYPLQIKMNDIIAEIEK